MPHTIVAHNFVDPDLKQLHQELLKKFHLQTQEIQPKENGFLFRFLGNDEVLDELIWFIQLERKRCPFLRFNLNISANGGPVWLEIVGPAGAKMFIEIELEIDG
jgi:hypothetical protein